MLISLKKKSQNSANMSRAETLPRHECDYTSLFVLRGINHVRLAMTFSKRGEEFIMVYHLIHIFLSDCGPHGHPILPEPLPLLGEFIYCFDICRYGCLIAFIVECIYRFAFGSYEHLMELSPKFPSVHSPGHLNLVSHRTDMFEQFILDQNYYHILYLRDIPISF